MVSFDIALEHFRRGVAGDFHDVEDVNAGQVHERGSGTTGGVRHHELVLLKDGNEFFLTRNADLGAGLFLEDVNIGDVLGPDDGFGLSFLLRIWYVFNPALGGGYNDANKS